MWYSHIKVGIIDIDMDHGNIDTMLQLYFSGTVTEAYLENVIDALVGHFSREEGVIASMGHSFPAEHKAEHEKLIRSLEGLVDEWKSGKLDGDGLANTVRNVLLNHVTEYDVQLSEFSESGE